MRERVCLVHLVREANGPEVLAEFVDALAANPPGTGHDLVLAMKGFSGPQEAAPYLELVGEMAAETLFFTDEGLDLGVYFQAAARLDRGRYCFLNSFSRPLVPGWLAKLDAALDRPGTGLVGATGSWASSRSWLAHVLRLPSAYRGVLPAPAEAIKHFMALEADRTGGAPARPNGSVMRERIRTVAQVPATTIRYDRFPARHIRTNAFMIENSLLGDLDLPAVSDKRGAYLVENGRNSITRQVQRRGLATLVVDREGVVFDDEHWHLSDTFWQSDQEGLLVEDNQTRCYAEADFTRRSVLSGFAWGDQARPTRPAVADTSQP